MKRTILAATLLALAALPAAAQTQVRVGLAGPDYFGYAPIVAAQELGLFAAQGVKVEVTPYRGAGPAQEALAAGAADIVNVAPIGAAIAVDRGVKQKVVSNNLFTRPVGFKLLVGTNSPIRTLKDLDGKKIGITSRGSGTDLYASLVRKQAGINAQLVPVGAGLAAALQSGNVDAIPMWATVSYRLLATGDARELHDLGSLPSAVIPDLWVASADMIEKTPAGVNGFLRGMMLGAERMKADRAFGLRIMKQFTQEENARALELAYDDFVKFGDLTGTVSEADFNSSLEVAAEAGLTTQPNAYARAVTNAFFPIRLR